MITVATDLKSEVLAVLKAHRGKSNAIPGRGLASLFGFKDDRIIREVIRVLIKEGYPIAASVTVPVGYFHIETWAEYKEYLDDLLSRLKENAYRRSDFKKCGARYLEGTAQGRLI